MVETLTLLLKLNLFELLCTREAVGMLKHCSGALSCSTNYLVKLSLLHISFFAVGFGKTNFMNTQQLVENDTHLFINVSNSLY